MDPEISSNQTPSSSPITNSLRTIRTLKGDVEASVSSGKTNVVSIAAAETERRMREASTFEERAKAPMQRAKMIGILLIVLATVASTASIYFYFLRTPSQSSQTTILPPDYIFSEQSRLLDISAKNSDQIITEMVRARQETEGQLGAISAVVPVETTQGVTQALPAENFISRLDPEAPQEVTRTLGKKFLFGIHIFDGNQPFLIFKPDTYETAFAGMLSWERNIPQRLGKAMRPANDWVNSASTTSSAVWSDAVISNKDTRVLRSPSGKTLMLYSFTDRSTLVITTNEQTFGEILRRIATVRATP